MLILHYNYFNVWYRTRVAHCTFEITLLQTIMLTLLLVCSFSPKVQSIFWGPLICYSALSLNKAMLRQILILRLVRQKPRLKWCFLSNCQKDTIAIIYNDGLNNDILINSGVDQVRKLVKADKMAFIVFGFDRQNGTYCVIHL